jgi:altronate dehydratase
MQNRFIVMHRDDNCVTSLEDIPKEEEVMIDNNSIKINQNIPLGHKIALIDIKKGSFIKKYGEIIGIATEDIKKGDWIHTHNIKSHYLEKIDK